jgi:hypothetical protein
MADDVWYYHHGGAQYGPATFQQLKNLAGAGELDRTDLVWQQGAPDWVQADTVPDLFPAMAEPAPAAPEPPPPEPTPVDEPLEEVREKAEVLVHGAADRFKEVRDADEIPSFLPHLRVMDSLLDKGRSQISEEVLDNVDRLARNFGNIAYIVAAALAFLLILIVGIAGKTLPLILGSFAILPAAILLHYAAVMFLGAGRTLIEKTPTAVSSKGFLKCYALLQIVAGFGALVVGFISLFGPQGFITFVLEIWVFFIAIYMAGIALSPKTVNVEVGGKVSAGEEAIGILSFLAKSQLRLISVLFGVGAIVGVCAMLYCFYVLVSSGAMFAGMVAMPMVGAVLSLGLLPFAVYVIFLLLYLGIDVLRSILVIPRKLDVLAEVDAETAEEAEE